MNRNVSWIFGSLLVLFIVGVPYEYYRYRYTTLKRLRVVDERKLYRSGCLTVDGFEQAIREYGIRTIVNLQEEAVDPELPKTSFSMQHERESELCKRLGVRYEFLKVDTLPYDREATEKPWTVDAFFKIMDDPTAWPVLIHCKAGLHRTGVLVALYRMEYDGYSVYRALEEMRDNGFGRNPSYSPNDYIRQYLANYVPRSKRATELSQLGRKMFGAGINACAVFGLHDSAPSDCVAQSDVRDLSELSERQRAFIGSVSGPGMRTDRIRCVTMTPASGGTATAPEDFRRYLEACRRLDPACNIPDPPPANTFDGWARFSDYFFVDSSFVEPGEQPSDADRLTGRLRSSTDLLATNAKIAIVFDGDQFRAVPLVASCFRSRPLCDENSMTGRVRLCSEGAQPSQLTPERGDDGTMPKSRELSELSEQQADFVGQVAAASSQSDRFVGSPHPARSGTIETKPPRDNSSLEKKLARPITINIHDMPLGRLIDDLQVMTGIPIEVHEKSLLDRKVSLVVEEVSVKTALDRIVENVDLDYDISTDSEAVSGPSRGKSVIILYTPRFWRSRSPAHLTPERIDGTIEP